MPGTNDILPFALGGAANLMPQVDYANTSSSRTNGFQRGVASSAEMNKVLRQVAFMARVLSQWAVDATGGSIIDNGDVANAESLLTQAVQAITNAILLANNYATVPTVNTHVSNLVAIITSEESLWRQGDDNEKRLREDADKSEAKTRGDNDTTEANTRLAQDQAIIAALASYMGRGTTRGTFARLISPSTFSGIQRLDLAVTLPRDSYVHVVGAINISIGRQDTIIGAAFTLWVDSTVIATEQTLGPMSLSHTVFLSANTDGSARTYNLALLCDSSGVVMSQIGLSLSYLAVQA